MAVLWDFHGECMTVLREDGDAQRHRQHRIHDRGFLHDRAHGRRRELTPLDAHSDIRLAHDICGHFVPLRAIPGAQLEDDRDLSEQRQIDRSAHERATDADIEETARSHCTGAAAELNVDVDRQPTSPSMVHVMPPANSDRRSRRCCHGALAWAIRMNPYQALRISAQASGREWNALRARMQCGVERVCACACSSCAAEAMQLH